ncbi:MAG: hypothetical protein HC809_05390 [Gammaproteobacteria bacterium]|nr:hypothetical protein [Gammaproteobacteria bacterium]
MHDIEVRSLEDVAQLPLQTDTDGEIDEGAVERDEHVAANANDSGSVLGDGLWALPAEVTGDDGHVVTAAGELRSRVVDMLSHSAEPRIIGLRDDANSHASARASVQRRRKIHH